MQIDVDPDQDFHVVIDGAAQALSLDALAEAYEADTISDETLIWQDGMTEWMRLDVLLEVLAEQDGEPEEGPAAEPVEVDGAPSAHETAVVTQEVAPVAPAPTVDPETYSVMVGPEDVQSMPLGALAEAHRSGAVNDQTLVWQPGATDWVPLSVIIASFSAGAQASAAPAPSAAPAGATSQPAVSAAPSMSAPAPSMSVAPAPSVAPVPSATPTLSGVAPAPSAAPVASVAPTANMAPTPSVAPPMSAAPTPSEVPSTPSAVASSPSVAYSAAPSAPNSLAPTAASVGPLSSSISPSAATGLDDLDFAAMKGGGNPWIKRSAIAAGALAFGFVIYQGASGSEEETAQLSGVAAKSTAAAPVVPEKKEKTAWEIEQELVEAARLRDEAAAKAGNSPTADAFGASLSGEEPKKTSAAPAKRNWKPKAKKSTSKNAGNSQYDPMNGAL